MKKYRWLIIFAIVIISAVILSSRTGRRNNLALENIVSEDIVYYISSHNPARKIKELKRNKALERIFEATAINKYFGLKAGAYKKILSLFLSEFGQKEVALALFSFPDIRLLNTEHHDSAIDFLFLSRVNNRAYNSIRKTISDIYLDFFPNINLSRINYRGIAITMYWFPENNVNLAYTELSDVTVIGDVENVKKSIDLFKGVSSLSLANNLRYRRLISRNNTDALMWIYGDTANSNKEILRVQIIKQLRLSLNNNGDGSVFRNLFFNPEKRTVPVASKGFISNLVYDSKSGSVVFKSYDILNEQADNKHSSGSGKFNYESVDKNMHALILPEPGMFYFGKNDFYGTWNSLKQGFAVLEKVTRKRTVFLSKIETIFSVKIDQDIIPLLGSHAGFVLMDREKSKSNIGLYGFFEIQQVFKMRQVMDNIRQRIVGQPVWSLTIPKDSYNGVEIYSFNTIRGSKTETLFNYFLLDRYLILSLSKEVARKVIDRYKAFLKLPDTVFASDFFHNQKEQDYRRFFYFDSKSIINYVTHLFRRSPEEKGNMLDQTTDSEVINTITDVLRNIKRVVFTSRMLGSDMLESEVNINLQSVK